MIEVLFIEAPIPLTAPGVPWLWLPITPDKCSHCYPLLVVGLMWMINYTVFKIILILIFARVAQIFD